jgi:hypothetical protein
LTPLSITTGNFFDFVVPSLLICSLPGLPMLFKVQRAQESILFILDFAGVVKDWYQQIYCSLN